MKDTSTYTIEGIHCDACIALISMELEEAGLHDFELDKTTGELRISEPVELSQLERIITGVGEYSVSSS